MKNNPMRKLPLAEIESIVGKENLLTAPEERMCYSFDATNRKFLPDAVAFPRSADDVSALMRCANLHRFPVIPRGAGSGFAGGSLAVEGGLVLALTRMNRIVSIAPENLTAVVEPGVVTGDFQKAVGQSGLFYPPDPASLQFSTMGGNAATCAGGPRCVSTA